MPDSWSVPIATGAITNLKEQIAKGLDYSWIGNFPEAYWQGQNQRYTQSQRDLFKKGLPTVNGRLDLGTILQDYAKVKGLFGPSGRFCLTSTTLKPRLNTTLYGRHRWIVLGASPIP
jgi:hypothetical protein